MIQERLRARRRIAFAVGVAGLAALAPMAAPGTASAQGEVDCVTNMEWKVEPLDVTAEQGAVTVFKATVTNRDVSTPGHPTCPTFKGRVHWLLPSTVDQMPVADVDGDPNPCGFNHCDLGGMGAGVTRVVTVQIRAGELTGDSEIKFSADYEIRKGNPQGGYDIHTHSLPDHVAKLHIVQAKVRDTTAPVIGKTKLTRGGRGDKLLFANMSLSEPMNVAYQVQYLAKGRKDSRGKCKKYDPKPGQPKWTDLPKSQQCKLWLKVRAGNGAGVKGKNKLRLDGKYSPWKTYRAILSGRDLAGNKAKSVTSSVLKATK